MNENAKDVAAQFGTIALATGLACLSQVVNSKMVEVVFGSIASNVASGYIDRLEYQKFQRAFLRSPHPTLLNHDLQKLVRKALDWTIQNLGILAAEQVNDKQGKKAIEGRVKVLRKTIAANFKTVKLDNKEIMYLIDQPFDAAPVIEKWQVLGNAADNSTTPAGFAVFVREHFAEQLQLCLGELLKHPDNRAALVAYNRQLHKVIAQGVEELKAQNEKILVQVEKPGRAPAANTVGISVGDVDNWFGAENEAKAVGVIRVALDSWTAELKAQLDTILDELHSARGDIARIGTTTQSALDATLGFDQALRENWMHKHRVLVLFGAAAVIAALVIGIIWKSQAPFAMTLNLREAPGLRLALDYPEFVFPMHITITGQGRNYVKEVTSSTDILFRDLPSELRNTAATIRVDGLYWESRGDTLVLGEGDHTIDLVPDEELAFVRGILRNSAGTDPLAYARIQIGTDTLIHTDASGIFKAELPFHMRRPLHTLTMTAPDGASITEEYRPRSGSIEQWLGN